MTDEEIFHNKMMWCGGRFDMSGIPPTTPFLNRPAEIAKRCIRLVCERHSGVGHIHFDYVSNAHIGAWAFGQRRRYFVGLNWGTEHVLMKIVYRMLADPRILPGVGNKNAEDEGLPLMPSISADASALHAAHPTFVMPKDPDRRLFGQHLIDLMMTFILWHELTHIRNGHIDYRNDRLKLDLLPELGWVAGTAEPTLTRQTLEMDADCGATVYQIGQLHALEKNPSSRPPAPWGQFYAGPKQTLFNWAFAVSIFFRVFGDESFAGVKLAEIPYPPIRVRQMVALSTAMTYVQERWDRGLEDTCGESLSDAVAQAEEAFSVITGKPRETDGLREAMGPGMRHVMDTLVAHWKTSLRKEVEPFAHAKLPD
jgi:hypothetical protein